MSTRDWSTVQSRRSFPTLVWFGAGCLRDLLAALQEIGGTSPLIVTDRGLAVSDSIAWARAGLQAAGILFAMFSAVQPNRPPIMSQTVSRR
ncbi:hypothetical protein P775_28470 [Puniceibacterium antarcticum]|uniref:Alcohol dehydrogenase iron-type/glycerol dehydrogenase GldA domain-containing protein n=1 Tax=Puniceibacterium antarcticum TaxID=1206336 RepID=A0A2G8QTB9_9RHOB|nr:iron-containing alcohol dehydrogenase [Puniceibacterium antarcticum]PIL12441.1 hypothetical protein P775_28470 [Puniceibacterium antarcticum]